MAHKESMIHTTFHLQRPRPVLCCTPSMVFSPVGGTNALATGHVQSMHCAEEPVGSPTSIPAIASIAWPCLYLNMQQALPTSSFHFYCRNEKQFFACFPRKSFNSWNDQKEESFPQVMSAQHTLQRLVMVLGLPVSKGLLLTVYEQHCEWCLTESECVFFWDQQLPAQNTTSCLCCLCISTAGSAYCSWQDRGSLRLYSSSCYPLKTQKAKSRKPSNWCSVSLCWTLYRGVKALP